MAFVVMWCACAPEDDSKDVAATDVAETGGVLDWVDDPTEAVVEETVVEETRDVSGEVATDCWPGQRECRGEQLWFCGSDALWVLGSTCGTACINSACSVCRPGALRCSENALRVCDVSGDGYTTVRECGLACFEGACCEPACEQHSCIDDGCGASCPQTCRACGQEPTVTCLRDECDGFFLMYAVQPMERRDGCLEAAREEYRRAGCHGRSMRTFMCNSNHCQWDAGVCD